MTLESALIEEVRSDLRSRGYDVVNRPRGKFLPDFLEPFSPDLIAYGPNDNVVVEFSRRGTTSAQQLRRLADAIRSKPGWKLKVVRYASGTPEPLPRAQPEQILQTLQEAEVLDDPRAALLLAWAAFEATARAIDERAFQRPQTPGRIIAELADRGLVDEPDQAFLGRMASSRNRLIHGGLDTSVPQVDVLRFIEIVRKVHDGAPAFA